jgi:hypothetical protein
MVPQSHRLALGRWWNRLAVRPACMASCWGGESARQHDYYRVPNGWKHHCDEMGSFDFPASAGVLLLSGMLYAELFWNSLELCMRGVRCEEFKDTTETKKWNCTLYSKCWCGTVDGVSLHAHLRSYPGRPGIAVELSGSPDVAMITQRVSRSDLPVYLCRTIGGSRTAGRRSCVTVGVRH